MKAKEIINWVVYFVCLLAVVFVINTFVVQRTMVSGDSMYPYLHNKDQLMMDKLSYRFHDPERFDIIVFPVVRDGKEITIGIEDLQKDDIAVVRAGQTVCADGVVAEVPALLMSRQ